MAVSKKKSIDKGQKKYSVSNNGWETTTDRFVCYIDIMGFKNWVERGNHDDIYKKLKQISTVKSTLETGEIKIISFSDSIVVLSKTKSQFSFEQFISVLWFLKDSLFQNQIPFKGAISFGKMTVDFDNDIFFGQPLIDAYLLQDELLLYGIVFDAEIENYLYEGEFEKRPDAGIPISYKSSFLCPFKNGNARHFILKGAEHENDTAHELFLINANSFRFKTSGHLRKYIDNTINSTVQIKLQEDKKLIIKK